MLSSAPPDSVKLFCFRRTQRLLNAHDYKTVFDKNDFRASHKNALMLVRLNQNNLGRLGLVIGKKNVRRSVDRNRLKRAARECFRLHREAFAGLDTVIMARQGLVEFDNKSFSTLLLQLIENARRQQARKQNP